MAASNVVDPQVSSHAQPATPAAAASREPPADDVDARVARVASRKDDWVRVPIAERVALLRRCLDGIVAVADRWVKDGCALKGVSPDEPLAGEEWVGGPMAAARNARLLIESLEQGAQPKPRRVRARPDGQLVADVFPLTMFDRALMGGVRAEVWIEPGKPATQGAAYRQPPAGKVSLVLGAGNVSSIVFMDVLYKLFVESEVVVLKVNPVNAYVGPHLEEAFRALVDEGYLAVVYGGADVGARLATHPQVDTLHVTGSDRTYDAIVWGADEAERARRKAEDDPKNTRPFTAELGCVTPILIVPGPWSAADMEFQARHVASMVAQNASFNCNAAKVLVTARGWLQRDAFLEKVERALAATRKRKAYYPGAEARYRAFLERYPLARQLGEGGEGVVPWTILRDVPAEEGEYALNNEAFCGVLAEVSLDAKGPREFLERAVPFANDRCWGNLSCGIFVHPTTADEYAPELDRAIAALRYGGIGVNAWPAIVYALGVTTWGAFPGNPRSAITSGSGVVHNTLLFDHPEKSVVYAPFRIRPKPAWFADHRTLHEVGRQMTRVEAAPTWGKVARVALTAMRG